MTSKSVQPRLLIGAIMAVLAVWGVFLAVGAAGGQLGMFDARKSYIVLGCVLAFLLFWSIAWQFGQRKASADENVPNNLEATDSGNATLARSIPSLISVLVYATGLILAVGGIFAGVDRSRGVAIGWAVLIAFGLAVLFAVVSLSDPQPRRGKRTAGVVILLVMLTIAGLLAYLNLA